MGLQLPADLEPFCDDDHGLHSSGAYALALDKPADPAESLARIYDERPPWLDELIAKPETIYVGASGDVLSRLEDHRDQEHRRASLLRVCAIDGLHTVWWAEDYEHATVAEFNLTVALREERPEAFVHSR